MCSTGDLRVYHKTAIIVPMRTLKFGTFTDIKSVVLFYKTILLVVLIHVYYLKPVSKPQRRKTYICASENVLLLITIHNLSFFYFQVKSCLCKINVVILLHSVELLILFHHTSLQRMAYLEYN